MGQRGPIGNESLRLLRGTARGDEEKKKPKARKAKVPAPPCPAGVSQAVGEEWRRVVPKLEADGRIVPGGDGLILAYCAALADLRKVQAALADGEVMAPVGANGYMQVRQEVALARRLRLDVLKLGAALGLTPGGDARLPKGDRPEEKARDAWDEL
jgi:phage terminase small subunit